MITCPRCRRGNAYPLRENPDRFECMNCGLRWGGREDVQPFTPPTRTDPAGPARGVLLGIAIGAIFMAAVAGVWFGIGWVLQ